MRGKKVKELRKIVYDELAYGETNAESLKEVKRTKEFQSIMRARKRRYVKTGSLTL